MEDYIKVGKIAAQAREFGKLLIKENASVLEIAEKVENKIKELGGQIAFPVDVSCNYIAAHDSPRYKDTRVLIKGDLVKLDLGVHINGSIVDTACTVEVGTEKYTEMINAVNEALNEVIKIFKPGVKITDIGNAIETAIKKKQFSPIRNLSGHEITSYQLHAGLTIPNYNNGNNTELKEGQIFAVEPFATTGDGIVIEGKPSEIYGLVNEKPVRDSNTKIILKFIKENYKTLPFAKRWIANEFGLLKANMALNTLEREGVIKQYMQLVERSKANVTQAEHTIIVSDNPIVLTK
ncbi:MAG: type II methionyl aminopeptidase [Nanoarchaeota archaeon]|nr:type II methionyl aminopeptidase [Nanoarchaeota archaeon]MBU0962865.1 type II methionyl aminopeptidase [Nanoarchaeota archaeon]